MELIKENGLLKVESAFNKSWVSRAKQLGGKWEKPYWVFDEIHEELVRASLRRIYGEDGGPVERIVLDIPVEDTDAANLRELVIGGIVVAKRFFRDDPVVMMNGAVLVSGGFPGRGGSMAHPKLGEVAEGTVIRCQFPEPKAKEIIERFNASVYTPPQIDREALEKEKKELMERLAEINAALG